MTFTPTSKGRNPIAGGLALAALVLALHIGLAQAASNPQSETDFQPGVASIESGDAARFVDARDSYERAQSFYRDHEYAKALGELDGAIRSLNWVMTHAMDRSVRTAAGNLLRRVASLRLATTRAIDAEKSQLYMIGPPTPQKPGASESKNASGDAKPAPADAKSTASESKPAADGKPAVSESKDGEVTVAAAPDLNPGDAAIDKMAESSSDADATASSDDPEQVTPDIESVSNRKVQKWVDYYTGRGRGTFEMWLTRSGLYMEWMKGVLKSEGLPTDLVHLVFVESGFNPQALSRSRAAGPWQFIRGTAKLFGLQMNSWIDERRDPERATQAAARYLKHLYSLFDSWPLALASYNAGEGVVMRAIARQGTKDFWQLSLPRETEDYVPKFLACLNIAREPERYGFDDVPREQPLAFDTIEIPGPVDLRAVADACGASVESVRALNPALLRHACPTKANGKVTLRVPRGMGDDLLAGLDSGKISLPTVQTPPEPMYIRHKVRRGETLATIARRYGVSQSDLARANGLRLKAKVRRGRALRVPTDDPTFAGITSRPAPSASSTRAQVSTRVSGKRHLFTNVRTIRVKRGETLAELAERHGTDVRTLRALNGLRAKQHIRAGATLKVPVQNEG